MIGKTNSNKLYKTIKPKYSLFRGKNTTLNKRSNNNYSKSPNFKMKKDFSSWSNKQTKRSSNRK